MIPAHCKTYMILETPATVLPLKYLLWFKVTIVLKLAREHFDKDGNTHMHIYTYRPRRHLWNLLLNYQGNMVHPYLGFDINPVRPRRSFRVEEMPLSPCQPLRTTFYGRSESVLNSRTISPKSTFFPSDENHCEALPQPKEEAQPCSWHKRAVSALFPAVVNALRLRHTSGSLLCPRWCRDYRRRGFLPSSSPQEEGVLHVFLIPGNHLCLSNPNIWDRKAWPLFISAPQNLAKTPAKMQAQLMWTLLSPSYLEFRIEPWPLSTIPHLLAKQTSSTLAIGTCSTDN